MRGGDVVDDACKTRYKDLEIRDSVSESEVLVVQGERLFAGGRQWIGGFSGPKFS